MAIRTLNETVGHLPFQFTHQMHHACGFVSATTPFSILLAAWFASADIIGPARVIDADTQHVRGVGLGWRTSSSRAS